MTRAVRIARWVNRRPLLAALAALGLIALLVAPTVLVVNGVRERAEQRRVETYTRHVRAAARFDDERRVRVAELAETRKELVEAEGLVPRHLPLDSPEKRAVQELRTELRRGEREIARLGALMELELRRSREAVDPLPFDDAEELALRGRLYRAALAAGESALAERHRVFLEAAGADPESFRPRGRLSLRTDAADAVASVFPCPLEPDGRRLVDREAPIAKRALPIRHLELHAGSYVVEITSPGRKTVTYPILVEDGEDWGEPGFAGGLFDDRDWTVALPAAEAFADDVWAYVPRGPHLAGPDDAPQLEGGTTWRWTEGFLIARDEVTFRDYLPFLEDPDTIATILRHANAAPEERGDRRAALVLLPRRQENGNPILGISQGRIALNEEPDFDLDQALIGVSHADARDFASWLLRRRRLEVRLPTADEWQKAARGVDGRPFAWGSRFDWSLAVTLHQTAEGTPRRFARPPRQAAADLSVYGVHDLTGNVSEWCADGPATTDPRAFQPRIMGGAYAWAAPWMYVLEPWNLAPWEYVSETTGFRLARDLPGVD